MLQRKNKQVKKRHPNQSSNRVGTHSCICPYMRRICLDVRYPELASSKKETKRPSVARHSHNFIPEICLESIVAKHLYVFVKPEHEPAYAGMAAHI